MQRILRLAIFAIFSFVCIWNIGLPLIGFFVFMALGGDIIGTCPPPTWESVPIFPNATLAHETTELNGSYSGAVDRSYQVQTDHSSLREFYKSRSAFCYDNGTTVTCSLYSPHGSEASFPMSDSVTEYKLHLKWYCP